MNEEFEIKDDAYWEWFYSSKLRVKRRVLMMEREAAKRLNLLLNRSLPLNDQSFASDLEWLLTWKLKTGCCLEFMWCDGIEFQKIEHISKRSIYIKGGAWVGPERNDDIFKVPLEAVMTLKPSGKCFKSYWFNIEYNGLHIKAKRT